MADRVKPKFKNDWRKKEMNFADKKYTREEIMKLYRDSLLPDCLNCPSDLVLSSGQPPCNAHKASISCVGSRRLNPSKESIPEWYIEEGISEQPKPIIPEDIEEEFSKIDVKYEDSIKKVIEEDDQYPEWDDPGDQNCEEISSPEVIIYPKALIDNFVNDGNPFACIIIAHSIPSDDNIITNPYSIPFEKVWYYKDPQNNVQGPFSTIDMFNWSAAGYFSTNLQIAHSSPTHFFSLQMYILQEKYKNLSNNLDKHL